MKRELQTKVCPICNDTFPRPSGKSNAVWKKQKCCGGNCASISRRKENPVREIRRKELAPGGERYAGWGGHKDGTKFGGMTKSKEIS